MYIHLLHLNHRFSSSACYIGWPQWRIQGGGAVYLFFWRCPPPPPLLSEILTGTIFKFQHTKFQIDFKFGPPPLRNPGSAPGLQTRIDVGGGGARMRLPPFLLFFLSLSELENLDVSLLHGGDVTLSPHIDEYKELMTT